MKDESCETNPFSPFPIGIKSIYGLLFLAGAWGALALAPFYGLPAMHIALGAAFWFLHTQYSAYSAFQKNTSGLSVSPVRVMLGGWWWGFGYFLASLWWIGSAFVHASSDSFIGLMPLGILGLPALLACFPALGFLGAFYLWSPHPFSQCAAFVFSLTLAEWLRGNILTGFPWNNLGMWLGGPLLFAQSASLVGLYGLTFLTLFLNAAPMAWYISRKKEKDVPKNKKKNQKRAGEWCLILAALQLIGMISFGGWRLLTASDKFDPNVRLRIVPGNFSDPPVFDRRNHTQSWEEYILEEYIRLSTRPTPAPDALVVVGTPQRNGLPTHVFWPESALSFPLSLRDETFQRITETFAQDNIVLLTGLNRLAPPSLSSKQEKGKQKSLEASEESQKEKIYFNSLARIDSRQKSVEIYDKRHLVPFGEYLPGEKGWEGFWNLLHLHQFVDIPGGFTAGKEEGLLSAPGLPPILPLICYEAIFPDPSRRLRALGLQDSPALLVNVTEDSWFGRTPGPYQHFSQTRLRAIEEGLPLVRAAAGGISAIIDSYGRVLGVVPLGSYATLDTYLPYALGVTIFSQYGNFILLISLAFCLLLTVSRKFF